MITKDSHQEIEHLRQQLAQRDDEIRIQSALIDNLRKQRRIVNKRVSNGTCPCCNRQFQNMRDHMRMKHPEFKAEAA